jgi:hypothetical protein
VAVRPAKAGMFSGNESHRGTEEPQMFTVHGTGATPTLPPAQGIFRIGWDRGGVRSQVTFGGTR